MCFSTLFISHECLCSIENDMVRYISLNCTTMYFFSSVLGDILGLEEGEPVEVHSKLIQMVQRSFSKIKEKEQNFGELFSAGLQMNTRDFYFREPGMIDEIIECYKDTKKINSLTVTPSIHQASDAQPFSECKDFFEEFQRNCDLMRAWESKNLTVHLPVREENDMVDVINTLTDPRSIKAIRGPKDSFKISIDLENNHHNTYFGNLYNCIEFIENLDDKMDEIGKSSLKSQLNFCFDYGHYITQAHLMGYNKQKMLSEFFESKKDRIKTLHLHNNDGIGKDQHILIGLHPENTENGIGHIGNVKVNAKLLKEHEEILLEALPILKLKERDDWNLVTETDKFYNIDILADSIYLLYKSM
jgi:sugar phosphate isomerase/epimerase